MDNDVLIHEPEDPALDLSVIETTGEQKTVVLQSANRLAPDQDIDVLREIAGSEVNFQPIAEKAEHVFSLKDIESQILGDGNVDLGRADIVNEQFGDLYGNVAKTSFTKVPTKSSFREIKYFMGTRIAEEEHALLDLFQTYLDSPCKVALATIEAIKVTYYPGLARVQESLISELKQNRDKIFSNPNNSVPYGDDKFLNMTTVNLLTTDFRAVKTELKTMDTFCDGIKAIQEIFHYTGVKSFVQKVLGLDPQENEISMVDLTNFILHDTCLRVIEEQLLSADRHSATVALLVSEAKAISHQPEKLSEFIVKNTKQFTSFHESLNNLAGLIYQLTLLNLAIKQLLMTYYEL